MRASIVSPCSLAFALLAAAAGCAVDSEPSASSDGAFTIGGVVKRLPPVTYVPPVATIHLPPPPAGPPPIVEYANVSMNTPATIETAITATITFTTPRAASIASVVVSDVNGILKKLHDTAPVVSHSFTLENLVPGHRYAYSVTLDDEGPNVVASDTFDAPAAPPDDGQMHTGTLLPKWNAVSLIYSPPGNGSNAGYTDGVSTGSTQSNSSSFKDTAKITFTSSFLDLSAGYGTGTSSGSSSSVTETFSEGFSLRSPKDAIDHGQDTFVLWLNPQLTLSGTSQSVNVALETQNGAAPELCFVTVAELQDPSTVAAAKLKACKDLPALLASDWDRQQILSLDQFLTPALLDGTRYTKVGQYVIAGPDAAGEDTQSIAINVGEQQQQSTTQTASTSASFSFASGGGFSFFVATSLKAGVDFAWDWQNSTVKSTQSSTATAVTLTTSTVKYADTIDVYVDQLFKSFAFVSHNASQGSLKAVYNPPGSTPVPVQQWPVVIQKSGSGTVIGGVGTVTPANASLDCGPTCSGWFTQGSNVTLQATPDAGWVFTGWSGACAGSSPTCTVPVSQEQYAGATFARANVTGALHTLDVTVVEDATCSGFANGSVSVIPSWLTCSILAGGKQTCSATFGDGAIADLWPKTLTSDTTFQGFSGDCAGSGECSLYMNVDHHVTATFCGLLH